MRTETDIFYFELMDHINLKRIVNSIEDNDIDYLKEICQIAAVKLRINDKIDEVLAFYILCVYFAKPYEPYGSQVPQCFFID